MALEIDIFTCRSDNFGYLLHDTGTGRTATLDAPEEGPIREALKRTGWSLTDVLITHHHADHTDAIAPLKADFGAKVTGPRGEAGKISGLDVLVSGGDEVMLGETRLRIFDTPGHTLGHIAYFDAEGEHLFTGDALFSLGCGRMFEGTPEPMWAGLKALRNLPDSVKIYFGHEYTKANAAFALSIDPDNEALKRRAEDVEHLRSRREPTTPSDLGMEKQANPFLRADDPDLARRMGLEGSDPAEVFAAIRKAKDNF